MSGTLEERSIASIRARLLNADSAFLCHTWNDIARRVKGGNEHGIFENVIRRDVVGYAVVHAVDFLNGHVFGGFVRSHYSGKPWNDIDVGLPPEVSVDMAWKSIVRFLTFCTPLQLHQLRWEKKAKLYAMCMQLHVAPTHGDPFTVEIDLLPASNSSGMRKFRPVTVGSCMQIQEGETTFRVKDGAWPWKTTDVIRLLENGEDVKLSTPRSNKAYRIFYWSRILAMERVGWKLHSSSIEEPVRPNGEELDATQL